MQKTDFPLIAFDTIDSTNNYAMQLIDADKAQPGMVITALNQTAGKGQRGKTWADVPGQSLLMTMIVAPRHHLAEQTVFNAAVACAIANVLQKLHKDWRLHIKWPNDIIINDKKAAGILIENVLRGSRWAYAVIGIGLNVRQTAFPGDLPNATSLAVESGQIMELQPILNELQHAINAATCYPAAAGETMSMFNQYLYKRDQPQAFSTDGQLWMGIVRQVWPDGTLEVEHGNGECIRYRHGQIVWEWNR